MIRYYQIKSPLSQVNDERIARFIGKIENELQEELKRVELDDYLNAEFALLYVASGGSEGYFLQVFDRLKDRKCYILTSGEANSLAASMEILSYLRQHGGSGQILHGDPALLAKKIRALKAAHSAIGALKGRKIGCIGRPSDWLIASHIDAEALDRKLGLKTVDIPMEELLSEIKKERYEENEHTRHLKEKEFDAYEVEKALHIYGAVKRLVRRHDLAGVSVRCFDLLDTVHSTGCLALSILNSEGIYSACEGDMPALLSMAVLGSVTKEDLFMCNPSVFDTKEGYATFAHCTLPLTMPDRFKLDTHFESGIGVAIRGSFDPCDCTLFKCSGDLSRYYVTEGKILDTPFCDALCRTQVRVRLNDFSYFLNDPIGNHHILCRGSHAAEVMAFFDLLKG
ncbi:MAG: hypothetical protein IJM50_07665 [Lachnospiraceae bacterium]|nr:hypothetical protein [Lachnospiraceae bacterium]